MNKEVKEKWVAALRSGELTQAHGILEDPNTGAMCCLGVLSKIAHEEGVCDRLKDENDDIVFYGDFSGAKNVTAISTLSNNNEYSHMTAAMPVIEWAGLESSNPIVHDPVHGRDSLAEFNDSGKSFEEIADIIERNL